MATAYRAFDKEIMQWEEKRDVLVCGEARRWANKMLELGRKVEVGIFSMKQNHWLWNKYEGKRTRFRHID